MTSSADAYLMDSVLMYLNRHNTNNDNNSLLEENRELRIMLQQMSDANQKMNKELAASRDFIAKIIDCNFPRVTQQNNMMVRCYRMLKFKESILKQNNIDARNAQQIDMLPLNTKRIINLNLMAFGELMTLPEIVGEYVAIAQRQSMRNMMQEADILASAITQNNNTQIHALQGWGYLQMMLAVSSASIDYIEKMQAVYNDENKANQWLKSRVSQLVDNCRFEGSSTFPIADSIPHPLIEWENTSAEYKASLKQLSATVSGGRPEYVFDTNNKRGYPMAPKGSELVKGPVDFPIDLALVWGDSLANFSSSMSKAEHVQSTLNGQRLPTLLNGQGDNQNELPSSGHSLDRSLMSHYGIK